MGAQGDVHPKQLVFGLVARFKINFADTSVFDMKMMSVMFTNTHRFHMLTNRFLDFSYVYKPFLDFL